MRKVIAMLLLSAAPLMGDVLEVNEGSFGGAVSKGLVVVEVYANWCGCCKAMTKPYHEVSNEIPQVLFAKANSDRCPNLLRNLGVTGLPTFILYKDGAEVGRVLGSLPKDVFKQKIVDTFGL